MDVKDVHRRQYSQCRINDWKNSVRGFSGQRSLDTPPLASLPKHIRIQTCQSNRTAVRYFADAQGYKHVHGVSTTPIALDQTDEAPLQFVCCHEIAKRSHCSG